MLWLAIPLTVGLLLICRMPRWPQPVAPGQKPLSIIIPARNEEANIGLALESIADQSVQPLETLVVDDHSSDSTADAARKLGADVLQAPPLPEDWRGKTWACRTGARTAKGEALLFMDADVRLRPDALGRIWAVWKQSEVGALSVGPYHRVERPYEELSAIFNIFTFAGMGSFSLFGSPLRPKGLFGPFLLIDKALYEKIGGHDRVKAEILENMTLCPILAAHGAGLLVLGGRGVVDVRMYPDGFGAMVAGWTKAFAAGADKTSATIMLAAVVWISGAILAALAMVPNPFVGDPHSAMLMYGAYAAGFYWMLRRVGSFSVLTALFYPLALIFYLVVFTRSLIRKARGQAVAWKGRSIGGQS